jgi:hypothetical protein
MSGWYVAAGDTHFNWASKPSYVCPNAALVEYQAAADGSSDGKHVLKDPRVTLAAEALAADPILLGQMLLRAHSSHRAGRMRVDGRLTERCAICGTKLTRQGFRAWIDGPPTEGSGKRIAERLGFGAIRAPIRSTWHKTRKEAEAWARHECKRAKATS